MKRLTHVRCDGEVFMTTEERWFLVLTWQRHFFLNREGYWHELVRDKLGADWVKIGRTTKLREQLDTLLRDSERSQRRERVTGLRLVKGGRGV